MREICVVVLLNPLSKTFDIVISKIKSEQKKFDHHSPSSFCCEWPRWMLFDECPIRAHKPVCLCLLNSLLTWVLGKEFLSQLKGVFIARSFYRSFSTLFRVLFYLSAHLAQFWSLVSLKQTNQDQSNRDLHNNACWWLLSFPTYTLFKVKRCLQRQSN